jgi:cobyrinic acid a,c-diamide synthase
VDRDPEIETVLELERGVGVGGGRDGLRVGSAVASYTHLHALGVPQWATGLVGAAAGVAS